MARAAMTVDEVRKNVPGTITRDMIKFSMSAFRIIFLNTLPERRVCYCTYCKKDLEIHPNNAQHTKRNFLSARNAVTVIAIDSVVGAASGGPELFYVFQASENGAADAICALGLFIRAKGDGDFAKYPSSRRANSMYLFEHERLNSFHKQVIIWQ